MRFNLDGLEVFFPYERVYLEQYQYMKALKLALDARGHALLEMPTGTGKTVCLLSLVTSYQYANPSAGKLVYCTRTVPEMNAVMEELGGVLAYRRRELMNDSNQAKITTINDDDDNDKQQSNVGNDETINNPPPLILPPPSSSSSSNSDHIRQKRPPRIYKRRRMQHHNNGNDNDADIYDDDSDPNMGPISSPIEGSNVLALCLSSRRNMCVHSGVVGRNADREAVDSKCRSMTASWVLEKAAANTNNHNSDNISNDNAVHDNNNNNIENNNNNNNNNNNVETCPYYNDFKTAGESTTMPSGVYDLNQLKKWGKHKGWCPYYLTRQAINHANVLVFNYQYMLDPKVAKMVSKELESDSIVVFDEAHNIDSVCIEALSVTINERGLEQATRSLGRLSSEVRRIKTSDASRLQHEYDHLLEGLVEQGLLESPAADASLASNVLSQDVLNEAVPGNIRRAEHFIAFMKKIVEHLKSRLRSVTDNSQNNAGGVRSETPLAFLHRMTNGTSLEVKPLRFAYSRLNSLLRTLRVSNLDDFNSLSDIADFSSLLSAYSSGIARFAVIMEPNGSSIPGASDPVVRLACLDSSLAIAPVFKRFRSVIITSGTLSPIELYPRLLRFQPRVSESLSMSTFRPCIRPLIVTRGSDQLPVSTRFEDRGDMGVIRNYGQLLVELASSVPDGIVAFFTSYSYMESIISEWDAMGVLRNLTSHKLVFIETKDVVETTLALDNYRRACDSGRGAIFLSVARGKVSEGINFDMHYGRAVVMFGVPFQYTLSHVLRARLEYLDAHYQIRERDFLNFDAIRQASQCVGRVVRSKTDYGLVILADARYTRYDKRSKLPGWILQFLDDAYLNLSTDMALQHVRSFLRIMGQPVDHTALRRVLLTLKEVEEMSPPGGIDVSYDSNNDGADDGDVVTKKVLLDDGGGVGV